MTTRTVETKTCDACNIEIKKGQEYVSATTYGVEFHNSCWDRMTARQAARLLGLDEIEHAVSQNDGNHPEIRARAWASPNEMPQKAVGGA